VKDKNGFVIPLGPECRNKSVNQTSYSQGCNELLDGDIVKNILGYENVEWRVKMFNINRWVNI